jgi:hypothetical protein
MESKNNDCENIIINKYINKFFDEFVFNPLANTDEFYIDEICNDIREMMDNNKWNTLINFCESENFCNHFINEFFSYYIIYTLADKKYDDIKKLLENHNDKLFNILTPKRVKKFLNYNDRFYENADYKLEEDDFIEFYKIDKLKNLLDLRTLKCFSDASISLDSLINEKMLEGTMFINFTDKSKVQEMLNKCKENNYNDDNTKVFIVSFFNRINVDTINETMEVLCEIKDHLKNIITPKCPVFKELSKKYFFEKDYYNLCKYDLFKDLITPEELEEFKQDINYRKEKREKLGPEYMKLLNSNLEDYPTDDSDDDSY